MFWRALILILALAAPALAERQEVTLPDGRFYLIDLPDHPTGAMILALHGGGGNPAQFARSARLSEPALAQGYAVLYPAGSGRGRLLTWNAGYCCGFAMAQGVDDPAFLDAVVRDAALRFGLDAGRTYATGMSNGAIMAQVWAMARPAPLRAVASVAGTMDLEGARLRQVPLLHIHGTADPHVLYEGGYGPEALVTTDFTAVPDLIAALRRLWPGLTASDAVIDPADDGMRVVQTDYAQAPGRVVLRLMTVEGGGHAWPGGTRAPRQGGTRDIDAAAEVLRFFALHP